MEILAILIVSTIAGILLGIIAIKNRGLLLIILAYLVGVLQAIIIHLIIK